MSLASRILGRLWKLPAVVHRNIASEPLRVILRPKQGMRIEAERRARAHVVFERLFSGRPKLGNLSEIVLVVKE